MKTELNTAPTSPESGKAIITPGIKSTMASMHKKVRYVGFQSAITAPGIFGGDTSLSVDKHQGIEMELIPGLLMVHYKNQEVLIPLSNIKALISA